MPRRVPMKTYRRIRTGEGTLVTVAPFEAGRGVVAQVEARGEGTSIAALGYGGSGPAQLALALAADALGDDDRALDVYQRLKFKLVGNLPHDGWEVSEDRIRTVVAALEQEREWTR